jgi:hypothetical protein
MLSNVKIKKTIEIESILLEVSETELDLIRHALGNCNPIVAQRKGFSKTLVSSVYYAILEAQKKIKEF